MPLKLDKPDKKLFAFFGVLLLLLVVVTALFKSSEGEEENFPSSYSASPGGAKAAYELLQGLGFPAERWSGTPDTLPSDPHKYVLVLAEPIGGNRKEGDAIRRFANQGGRILVTGMWGARLFSQLRVVSAPLGKETWRTYHALAPSEISRSTDEIKMRERFTAVSQPGNAIYGDTDTSAVVVLSRYGKGEVIWWADTTPLTNAGIREPGNMELLLNTLGNGGRTVLWDEYFHGASASLWSYLNDTPARMVTRH